MLTIDAVMYDNSCTYDDTDAIINKLSHTFIKQKSNDETFGFSRVMSLISQINNHSVDDNVASRRASELKIITDIMNNELILLCKSSYFIYNLNCNEEYLYSNVKDKVIKHVRSIVKDVVDVYDLFKD